MNDKASFDVINYSLRPNKNIERKLIFESLRMMDNMFDFSSYRYVGMGSLWFVDFILAHKMLHINNMVSIERPEFAKRVEFNKPYNCINIEPGETTLVLPTIDLEKQMDIVWLDYDSDIIDSSVLADLYLVLERARPGSILIVTLNADIKRLDNRKDSQGNILQREDALRHHTENLVPATIPRGALQRNKYPSFLSELLFDHAKSVMNKSGRKERFYRLYNFFYRDKAPMITIGGIVSNDEINGRLKECNFKNCDYLSPPGQYRIETPPLTPKEKSTLDELFPSNTTPTPEQMETIGFNLKQEQLEAYTKFYKLYPLFAEVSL